MLGSIHEVIEAFRQLSPTNSERGTKFEQLMVRYFELDPMLSQQYEQVWRWIDWPDRKGKPDTGIDLVARTTTVGVGFPDYFLGGQTISNIVTMPYPGFELPDYVLHRLRRDFGIQAAAASVTWARSRCSAKGRSPR